MPLGIVSEEEFLAELVPSNSSGTNHLGRGNSPAVPEIIREIASEAAISGQPAKEISQELGISQSAISAYKHDATSTATYNKPADHLRAANTKVRERISSRARKCLLAALDEITPDKLAGAKVRDAASVAKDMSAIMRDMEPPQTNSGIHAQFIFHVPPQRKESDFDIIEVTQ